MFIPLLFSSVYEVRKYMSQPKAYFKSFTNILSVIYHLLSFVNIIVHFAEGGSDTLGSKIVFQIVALISLQKIFFFYRYFHFLSYIVSMVQACIYSLLPFFVLYFILVLMMQQMICIGESSIA